MIFYDIRGFEKPLESAEIIENPEAENRAKEAQATNLRESSRIYVKDTDLPENIS